ncbi:MAG: alpha/beta hydrolase, partial [Bacteroidia bacterium]
NTMSMEDTQKALNAFVVPESRNVARSSSGNEGRIDFKKPHAPLLFIAGEKDHIIPASLNKKNFEAYSDAGSKKEFKEFSGRSHFICSQPGWEEVASFVQNWLNAL